MKPPVASLRIMQRQCRSFLSGRMAARPRRASNNETWRCLLVKAKDAKDRKAFHVSSTVGRGNVDLSRDAGFCTSTHRDVQNPGIILFRNVANVRLPCKVRTRPD